MRFKDKVVVITGASSGIGLAVATLFLKEGAQVIMVARGKERGMTACEKLKREVSSDCSFISCDVSDEQQVQDLFDQIRERYGRVDVLHNNAGVSVGSDLERTTSQEWDQTLDVNLKGAFLCSQKALPLLKKSGTGAIINTISELGLVATKGCLAYLCSKGGLLQLTRGMAVELAQYRIRVNAICPAGTESEMFYNDMRTHAGGYEESVKALAASYPLGRIAVPMDIAPAVLFLASEEASFITGTYLVLDGGFTAT